ncbi:low molecular weight protein-tyrosine-phosphatase [Bowmanella sp. JS7-9]|uniref:protein-tyrosine-phosphatase n=1 Tax=Pseudobowmanella zhangzhouensis TaxID=1537679 RepID=A0ABW1XNE3_9ALTE|nr:low molecular weight protein-tyrosine-phosphatase [Bowmanella sp. JS7-9]TBX23043.1 protein tyrosine phosphatase [Bowmanella sp. JS7-9]
MIRSVLFVCLGNICRSPTAEAVFTHKARDAGLKLDIDSAGTQGYHRGAKPDPRSAEAGQRRGYDFSGLHARRVEDNDFHRFDLILAMDQQNFDDLMRKCPPDHQHKIRLFLSFADAEEQHVPDPYYGGTGGFEYVLDLIEQASDGLIQHLTRV